jgi:hypothetical protein
MGKRALIKAVCNGSGKIRLIGKEARVLLESTNENIAFSEYLPFVPFIGLGTFSCGST